jgi:hypothetical protein
MRSSCAVIRNLKICDSGRPKELLQDRVQRQVVWNFLVLLPLPFKLPDPKLKKSCRHVRRLNHAIHLLLSYVNFRLHVSRSFLHNGTHGVEFLFLLICFIIEKQE